MLVKLIIYNRLFSVDFDELLLGFHSSHAACGVDAAPARTPDWRAKQEMLP